MLKELFHKRFNNLVSLSQLTDGTEIVEKVFLNRKALQEGAKHVKKAIFAVNGFSF